MPDVAEAPEDLGLGPAPESPGKTTERAPLFSGDELAEPAPSQSAPDTSDSPAAETEAFDWEKVDFRRAKEDDVPETQRPLFRALQKQVRAAQGDRTRELQDIQRREQALNERWQRVEALERRIDTMQQQPKPMTAAERRKVAELLNDPSTDQDTRQALMLVDELLKERFQELVGDRFKDLDELKQIFPQVQQAVSQMTQAQRNDHLKVLQTQVVEAQGAYGDDINQYSDDIRVLMGLDGNWMPVGAPRTNRATGKPYTVKEAYELFAGITAQKAQEAREQDRQIRTQSKRAASSPSSTTKAPPTGALSESEALSQIRNLGFGRQ